MPDEAQLQIFLGSLLGDGRVCGHEGDRRLRVAHALEREDYVRWKYDRLLAFAADGPHQLGGQLWFETIAHPIFDDLARLFERSERRRIVRELLAPLGLAVWMADVGRLELRAGLFLPAQRAAALVA